MIRFHREGYRIIGFISLISVSLIISFIILLKLIPAIIFIFLTLIFDILIFRFFRIPKRYFKENYNAVLAPADGTVVAIERVHESEYFNNERVLVSIFMSIYNVHINWFPIKGEIKYFNYHPGKYLVARHPKSSELNERTSVAIKNERIEILVRQIAGYVARRVICYARAGQNVRQAEEMGFIKFGSRLDLYLPLNSNITVNIGDKAKGGITPICFITDKL